MPRTWLVGLLVLALTGCQSTTSRPQDSAIRIRWERDPESLDPLALPNQQAIDVANLLSPSLLQVDLKSSSYAPALATRLPRVQALPGDRLQLDYYLRPEATWDDGCPVLAADVAFTLKLLQCPNLPHEDVQAQVSFISECRPDSADPRHVVFICQGQAPEYRLASGDFPIVAEHLLDSTHTLRAFSLAALRARAATLPAAQAVAARYQQANVARQPGHLPGCGPYRLVSWQPGRALLFRRKAHWWADRVPAAPFVLQVRASQLQFLVLPDAAAAALALQRHELDVFPQVPARVFRRLQASESRQELAFSATPSYDVAMVGFNTRLPALRDARTRQALGCLLDPVALLAATQLGQGQRTASLVPPGHFFYNDSLPLPAYQPERAAELLRQAGWQQTPAGWQHAGVATPLHLTLRYRADDNLFQTIGLQWQSAAAKLGIRLELRPTEASVLGQALHAGDFDLYGRLIKGNPFVFDFSPILRTGAEGNFTQFSYPQADRLLAAIKTTGEPARKRQLLRRLQALVQQQAPLLPLFFTANRVAASRQLRYLTVSGLKPGYVAATLSWAGADSLARPR